MLSPTKPQLTHCTLDAEASLASSTLLRLHYRVRNLTAQHLFLFNRFWTSLAANREYQVRPNTVNIQVTTDRVTIGKAVVPVPDDLEVEKHYTPCLSSVGPHGTYEETLEIPLPLAPFTWYQAPWHVPAVTPKPSLLPLYFELGYLAVSPRQAAAIRPVATSHGPAYFWLTEPEDQLLLHAGPLLPQVEVLMY